MDKSSVKMLVKPRFMPSSGAEKSAHSPSDMWWVVIVVPARSCTWGNRSSSAKPSMISRFRSMASHAACSRSWRRSGSSYSRR